MGRDIEEEIGDIVRKRRRVLRLTQAQLGRRAGLPHQTIHNIECGSVKITVARLHDLARALEVPLLYFFQDGPYARPGALRNVLADDVAHLNGPSAEPYLFDLPTSKR